MLKKYFYIIKNSYLENNLNKTTVFFSLLYPIIQTFGFILFFSYLVRPDGATGGSVDNQILIYFLFILVVSSAEIARFSQEIQSDITTERYNNINRMPINPFVYYFLKSVGKNFLVFMLLLLFSVGYMIFIEYSLLGILLFVPSVIIGFLLTHLIFFTATCVNFCSEHFDIWFFNIIFDFLSGKLIPVNFLLGLLQTMFLSFMPFTYAFGAIAKDFSGSDFNQLFFSLSVSVFWIGAMFFISNKFWNRGGWYFQEYG
jgi:ABC-type uncharacterized transport system permease subunit